MLEALLGCSDWTAPVSTAAGGLLPLAFCPDHQAACQTAAPGAASVAAAPVRTGSSSSSAPGLLPQAFSLMTSMLKDHSAAHMAKPALSDGSVPPGAYLIAVTNVLGRVCYT